VRRGGCGGNGRSCEEVSVWRAGVGPKVEGGIVQLLDILDRMDQASTEGQTGQQVDGERIGYLAGVCSALHCTALLSALRLFVTIMRDVHTEARQQEGTDAMRCDLIAMRA